MNWNQDRLKSRSGFSLIELIIVIVIIGALTAIIIPQFDASESQAKDTGCDASNYGTLRQLGNFRSVNGVYPSRLHTGYESLAGTDDFMGTTDGASALAEITENNFVNHSTKTTLTADQAASLTAAGMNVLAYGGFGIPAVFEEVDDTTQVAVIDDDWFEAHGASGTGIPGNEVTVNGLPVFAYAASDPQLDYAPGDAYADLDDVDGIVVPFFAAPTADWENAVIDGVPMASKIGVAQVGGCPWLEGGEEFRYYIAFFKAYNDGRPAKMIGTACPEGGSMNP